MVRDVKVGRGEHSKKQKGRNRRKINKSHESEMMGKCIKIQTINKDPHQMI